MTSFPGGSEFSDVQEKESETDSEKEPCCESEGAKNCLLNTIREEKETGSEASTKKSLGESGIRIQLENDIRNDFNKSLESLTTSISNFFSFLF